MQGVAAVSLGPRKEMVFREFPLPDVGPDDILVRVRRSNICGSDLHIWHGHGPEITQGEGFVPGHEMVGEVFRLGRRVKTDVLGQPLEEGDRIAYTYFLPCGSCAACMDGSPACPNRSDHWFQDAGKSPHFRGAYGEYYYLRRGQTVCKIPSGLSDSEVSPVNCALCQVLYGLDQIGIRLGDTIVVQGAGGLGLYASALAKEMGAGQVIVFDRLESRLELARSFGADLTVNIDSVNRETRREMIMDLTRGEGADVVAEFVGSPLPVEEGVHLLRQFGRYLWVGNIAPGRTAALDPALNVRSGHTLRGVIAYAPWALPRALDFLARRGHAYPFEQIVSHTFPLTELNEAFALADEGKAIRVSLTS